MGGVETIATVGPRAHPPFFALCSPMLHSHRIKQMVDGKPDAMFRGREMDGEVSARLAENRFDGIF